MKRIIIILFVLCLIMSIMTVAFASDYYDEEASVRSPITYAQLVGITNSGHNHSSWMSSAETYLLNCGEIDDVAKHTGAFTVSAINGYMNVNTYKVFIIRCHGGVDFDSNGNQLRTKLKLNDSDTHPVYYNSDTSFSSVELSNLKIALFVACKTGHAGTSGKNLPNKAHEKGAQAAVGFSSDIVCSKANSWTIAFCQKMSSGYSVQTACTQLASMLTYNNSGLDNWVLCGSGSTTIY